MPPHRIVFCFTTCLPLLLSAVAAQGATLEISAQRVQQGDVAVENVRMQAQFTPQAPQSLTLSVQRTAWGEHAWGAWSLTCPQLQQEAATVRCTQGEARLAGHAPLAWDGLWNAADRRGALNIRQGQSHATLALEGDETTLTFARLPLAPLAALLPAAQAFAPAATLGGELRWYGARQALSARLNADEGRFGSADGLLAGDKLRLALTLDATRQSTGWRTRAVLDWQAGEAFVNPLYLTAEHLPRLELHARLTADGQSLHIDRLTPTVADIGAVHAQGQLALAPAPRLLQGRVRINNADLTRIGARWLAPVLFPDDPQKAEFTGRADGEIALADGRLETLTLLLAHAGISVPSRPLQFGPIDGEIPWQRNDAGQFHLRIGGGQWHKLHLGAFQLDGRFNGPNIRFSPIRMPLLDGAVLIDHLDLHHRDGNGWHGQGSARIATIDMAKLTDALGLPQMHGALAADLPGLRLQPGELSLDGQLTIGVFDGTLAARNLRILEPFGTTSRLTADLSAHHIDLYQLSRTFSFGSIQGYLDGQLDALELHRWQPVAFRARFTSSPGDYPRQISQRAVENLTDLAGGMASLQRAVLRIFKNFGYSRIGLGCTLENGICTLSGIDGLGANNRMVFVEGRGIPALNVIGYNRRIDWQDFVDRVQAVIQNNQSPLIE